MLLSIGCSIYAQDTHEAEWTKIEDKDGICLYSRERTGLDFNEFKGHTIIHSTLKNLVSVITDVDNYPHWMHHLESSSELDSIDPNTKYLYCESWAPWPFHNRDMPSLLSIDHLHADTVRITIAGQPDYMPVNHKIVRMKSAEARWLLYQLDDNTVFVQYEIYGDPGSRLPRWVLHLFIDQVAYKVLKSLRNYMETYEYQYSK